MRIGYLVLLASAFAVSSCGTIAQNSEVPNAPYLGLGDRREPSAAIDVKIVESGPIATEEAQKVQGYSCKNKLWDPDPNRENAIAFMKQQAAERGYHAIHSVEVVKDENSVIKNCWAGISATGIAFNEPSPDPIKPKAKAKR